MIYFHHILKAGGNFILGQFQLRVNYRAEYVDYGASGDRGAEEILSIKPGSPVEFALSHHAFDPSYFTPKEDDFYFTLIRHPVDMFYSYYHYFKDLPGHEDELTREMEFEEYMDYKIKHYNLSREMIRNYGLVPPKKCPIAAGERVHGPGIVFPQQWYNIDFEKFDFVGITDEMEDTLKVLGSMTGLVLDSDTDKKINSSKAQNTDKSYRRSELEEVLKEEIRVYKYYKNILKAIA